MSKMKKLMIAGMAAALMAGGAFATLKPGQDAGAAEQGAQQAMPVPVAVIKKEPQRIWHAYAGRMTAVDYVELLPQVSGKVEEIKFEDGSIVQKGDVLFVIDPRPYQANADQARAALSAAQSQHDLAEKELTRAEELIKTEAISQRQLDERKNAAQIAKNTLDGATALVEKAEIDLDHAYLKAPISGRVSRPEITVGNLVQAGSGAPVLTTIVSHEGIYADFEVDEQTYLNSIRGQASNVIAENKIPIQLSLEDGAQYDGAIKSFDNHINRSTGTIRARAYFDNEDGTLLPGMFVTVKMGSPVMEDVMLLTDQAVGTDQDRKYVYVVGDDGKVMYREVKLGATVDGKRVVLSGLTPGEKVVVGGLMKVHPEMVVAPQIEQATAGDDGPPDAVPAAGEKE